MLMKEIQVFYRPEELPLNKIIPAYQEAFAGEPWYEVSKCADNADIQRCIGGFSSLSIGTCCGLCGERVTRPAYEVDELKARFSKLASSRPTAWYVEENQLGTTLAALAWKADVQTIATEKYADVPEMFDWMREQFGTSSIMWLDEVFADRNKKPKGNLQNFSLMCYGLAQKLDTDIVAYRTIAPAMIIAPVKNFGKDAQIFQRKIDVPDRRDFVIIKKGGERT